MQSYMFIYVHIDIINYVFLRKYIYLQFRISEV